MTRNDYLRSFFMLLPGIALMLVSIYAAYIRTPALALDNEAVSVISAGINYRGGSEEQPVRAPKKPKINKGAAASAKGLAAGAAAPAGAGGSTSIGHNSALDNATFKDGTYYGAARGFSGTVRVKVVISGGKIKSVSVVSHSDTPSYMSRAKKVASRIAAKNSTRVDAVSGATFSSKGIIKAAENALMKAAGKSGSADNKKDKKKKSGIKVSGKKYKDGEYTASAPGYHGDVTVKVTVKNRKISKVEIVSHTDTPSYFNRARKITGRIVKYNRADVDTVSGATFSSKGIINAVKKALKKASGKSGAEDKPAPAPDDPSGKVSDTKYENGTYEGSAVGYTGGNGLVCMTYVTVTVENNKIAKIDVESQDPTLSGDDWYWKLVYPKIPDAIIKTNDPDVDAVSGATMSSNGIMNAVKDALKGHELKEDEEKSGSDMSLASLPEGPDADTGNDDGQMNSSEQQEEQEQKCEESSSESSPEGGGGESAGEDHGGEALIPEKQEEKKEPEAEAEKPEKKPEEKAPEKPAENDPKKEDSGGEDEEEEDQ